MISGKVNGRTQLPGVYFRTETSPPQEALPRMDIAAFVGFAAAGPPHIPVPVEDMDRFHQIFGGKLPLAWDQETAQMQYAYLESAVEAFFQNGGRRCWIVRAAENAQPNKYVIPAIIRTDKWQPELTRARSGGSWSDHYLVGCTLAQQPFEVKQFSFEEDKDKFLLNLSAAPAQLAPGDLLRLTFAHRVLFLCVDQVDSHADSQQVTSPYHQVRWFKPQYPLGALSPESHATAELRRPDCGATEHECQLHLPQTPDEAYRLDFENPLEPTPSYGDVLYVKVLDNGHQNVLLSSVADTLVVMGSNTEAAPVFRVQASGGLWLDEVAKEDAAKVLMDLMEVYGDIPFTDLLSFSLSVWQDQEPLFTLDNLGFCEDHSRFWAQLPTDESLYRQDEGRRLEPSSGTIAAVASVPRFPLAGPEDTDAFYIPLGMPFMPDPYRTTGALDDHAPDTRLARDGLKVFTSGLFLDKDLIGTSSQGLPTEANYKQYLHHQKHTLRGLHSLWGNEEVTLIAIPDAVQRGWQINPRPLPRLLDAPELNELECIHSEDTSDLVEAEEERGRMSRRLSWNSVHGAQGYTLQEASDPDFKQPLTRHLDPATSISIPLEDPCPQTYYYRVRAIDGALISPWSNCCMVTCPNSHFADCQTTPPPFVDLEKIDLSEAEVVLRWKLVEGENVQYFLERAEDPSFETQRQTKHSPNWWAEKVIGGIKYGEYPINLSENKITYYRVRAKRDGQLGPWSNTVVISHPTEIGWAMVETMEYASETLQAIQRAMLSFSAASGDVFAVLSMPSHYRYSDVLEHKNNLQAPSLPLTAPLEERDLSFGALYHPWLIARTTSHDGDQTFQRMPADGALCGTIAATALGSGAWVAPANTPIKGIVSLEPTFGRTQRVSLFEHQINVVCRSPRGFLTLNADTLSPQVDLSSINVRRLLSLLRRLALREGEAFVFEPNSAAFRRRVKHHFENFLEGLFTRGAFAGRTAKEAYWVRVDDALNPSASIDVGRFVIELRVAPSQPLVFMIVQLVQQEFAGLSVGEV